MTIFLILAPYGAFAPLMLLTSAKVSVFAAAAICLAVMALDFVRGPSLKWLGAGSAMLFAGVGLYVAVIDPGLGKSGVKLAVDTGIFAISLISMLIHRPFTLQYAIEAVPAETAGLPGFLRANYIITAAWTAAALVMMASNGGALRAGTADLVGPCDCLRRPQQRDLFHQMVSAIPQGEGRNRSGRRPPHRLIA